MVLERAFVGDTDKASAHSLFWSPGRQSSLSQYDKHTWKPFLKREFITDMGKPLCIHHSALPGDRAC